MFCNHRTGWLAAAVAGCAHAKVILALTSADICCRWCNQLNPGVRKEPFTEEEVRGLVSLVLSPPVTGGCQCASTC
jgi:hypothetical protein